ncbi:MAG: ABC transporter permease [Haloferacaceae archaeon]
MDAAESLRMSLRSVRAHKLRAALTVLGIVIGIASVVTFATFGASLKADVVSEIGDTSASNVYLLTAPEEGGEFGSAIQPVFTEHDLARIRTLDGVSAVIPRGNVPTSAVSYGGDTVARTQVTATTPATFRSASFVAGRGFRSGEREVVLNRAAARSFESNVTVGSTLTVELQSNRSVELAVVGVVNRTQGQLPVGSFGSQARFFVPADPFYRATVESPALGVNQRVYPQVTVQTDPAETTRTKRRIRAYLDHSDAARLAPSGTTVTARTSGDFIDRIERIIERLTRFVTGIAVIALVVGAVGIANIMLVSVTERTREIGIMKAVGATNRDVMQLFLVESSLLGVFGAVVGVPLGTLAGWGATRYADVGFTLAPTWFAIAVAVGLAVGVAAGLYPAWKAARVDPIDALRHE